MKINLNKQFEIPEGVPINLTNTMAKELSNLIFVSSHKDSKWAVWAYDLYKTSEIDISKQDLDELISFIKESSLINLCKSLLLEEVTKPV